MNNAKEDGADENGNFYYWRHAAELASVLLEAFLGLFLLALWFLLR